MGREKVAIDQVYGHGGLFKTEGVAQNLLAAAIHAPVTVMETAGDGEDYGKDIIRFADGDKELEEKFFTSGEQMEPIRTQFIRDYVEAAGINVTAYKDYGWDAVPLK